MDIIKINELKVYVDNKKISGLQRIDLSISGDSEMVCATLHIVKPAPKGGFGKSTSETVDVYLENWRDSVVRFRNTVQPVAQEAEVETEEDFADDSEFVSPEEMDNGDFSPSREL